MPPVSFSTQMLALPPHPGRAPRLVRETGQPWFPALPFAQTPPKVVLLPDSPADSFAGGEECGVFAKAAEEVPASQMSWDILQIVCRLLSPKDADARF